MQKGAPGCTSYKTQSQEDIKNDLENWVKMAAETRESLLLGKDEAQGNGYWKKVGLDFKNTVASSINYCVTIICDLNIVIDAIENKKIGEREIRLLESIGNEACKYNEKIYKESFDSTPNLEWHDYEDLAFRKIERMYIIGRDFFATLEDALNMATRLKDYIGSDNTTVVVASDSIKKMSTTQEVLDEILFVGDKLCVNKTYNSNSDEDSINDYVRDNLSNKYFELRDQTRHGSSSSGKKAGEVDIILFVNGKEVAIYEGLVLNGINTTVINNHIEKAIMNYNPLGTATFIAVYYNGDDYLVFWNKFFNHIKGYIFPKTIKSNTEIIEQLPQRNAATHVAHLEISRDGFNFPVYFITWKLQK